MRERPTLLASLVFVTLLAACGGATPSADPRSVEDRPAARNEPRPPIAKTVPHELRAHDQVRQDPYYWMRDDDEDDPEVLAYLRAENDYADAMLAPVAGLREALYREIVARIPPDDVSVPARLDDYLYYTREEAGKEYPIYCRKRGSLDSREQIMLDANVEAEPYSYYAVRGLTVTTNGGTLAYAEDTVSRRIYTVRFRNLDTGESLPDRIEGTSGDLVWASDDRTIFYVKREEGTLREYQVWRHVLGSDVSTDALVYEETDPEYSLDIFRSRSREYLMIGSYQTLSNELRYVDLAHPQTAPRVVLPREERHEYEADHLNGRFYIRTNWEARDFRLMSVEPRRSADKRAWREEIPAQDGVLLQGFELFSHYLVVSERRDGISRLRVIPWRDRAAAHEIAFDEPVYATEIDDNPEADTDILRFNYTSLTTPVSIFDYDMGARTRTLRKEQRVVGDFDRTRYVTSRIVAHARDGTEVPISIVHRRDLDRSEPHPLLLYGYGAYGYSTDPQFSASRLSLLDRGCRLRDRPRARRRGDGTRAGTRTASSSTRQNTFTDFIDCDRVPGRTRSSPLAARSSRPAAAPAGCSWARSPTCGRTSIAGSSRTCRSSTSSRRCSTTRSRSRPTSTTSGATRNKASTTTTCWRTRRTTTSRAGVPVHARHAPACRTARCSTSSRRSGSRSCARPRPTTTCSSPRRHGPRATAARPDGSTSTKRPRWSTRSSSTRSACAIEREAVACGEMQRWVGSPRDAGRWRVGTKMAHELFFCCLVSEIGVLKTSDEIDLSGHDRSLHLGDLPR